MKKQLKNVAWMVAIAGLFTYCQTKKKDPEPAKVEQEVITDYYLEFTDTTVSPATVQIAKYVDPDGDGGVAASITGVTLLANKVYKISNELYDKSKSSTDTITAEVEEKDLVHRFIYAVENTVSASPLQLTVSGLNLDASNQLLGLKGKVTTGAASSGKLKVTLRHYDSAAEKTSGLTNSALGETDVEVEFPITIQ